MHLFKPCNVIFAGKWQEKSLINSENLSICRRVSKLFAISSFYVLQHAAKWQRKWKRFSLDRWVCSMVKLRIRYANVAVFVAALSSSPSWWWWWWADNRFASMHLTQILSRRGRSRRRRKLKQRNVHETRHKASHDARTMTAATTTTTA